MADNSHAPTSRPVGAKKLNPIINTPYGPPSQYYLVNADTKAIMPADGRRRSQNMPAVAGSRPRRARIASDGNWGANWQELTLVNEIRDAITEWREVGYPGVTSRTREDDDGEERESPLYFEQIANAAASALLGIGYYPEWELVNECCAHSGYNGVVVKRVIGERGYELDACGFGSASLRGNATVRCRCGFGRGAANRGRLGAGRGGSLELPR